MRLLIGRGADVSAANNEGSTPLHYTSHRWYGNETAIRLFMARLLIDEGADISAVDNKESTPLHRAAERGDEAVVRLLIDEGADTSAIGNKGSTLLHRAESGNKAVARSRSHCQLSCTSTPEHYP